MYIAGGNNLATPAQKHFRKEMKELNRSSHPFSQTDIYQPALKSRRPRARWSYSLIAIVLVLTVLSGMPKQFYNNFIVYKPEKMIAYLKEQQAYTEQSGAILNTYLMQSSTPASKHRCIAGKQKDPEQPHFRGK
jgi:hypothetical protein